MENVQNAVVIETTENLVNSFKVTIKNGNNAISFQLENAVGNVIDTSAVELLSNEIVSELTNLNETNNRLKEIGYKGNFFRFTTARKCVMTIEMTVKNSSNMTLIKNLEFSFGKIAKLREDVRERALFIILGGQIVTNNNNLLIEKC